MIYRWFWRCSSDPNAHSSFTVAPAESLKSVKTFRRPADGRKMKRDHPNCWTAQLNTIVKHFFLCVCVWTVQMIGSDTDHQPSAQSPRVQMVRDHPAGVGFHLQHLLLSSLSWRCDSSKPSLQEDRVLFSGEEKRDAGFSLQQSAKNRTLSSLVRSFPFNCSVFIQCIKKEAWGRSGILEEVLKYDKDWQILMEVNSGLVVSDR